MENSVEKALTHLLNIHGFSFQYAVLNVADEYFSNGESPWCFEVAEFPVEVNGISLHIDFILRNEHEPFFLVAECKRVDPALANWCFIKAPFVSRKIRSSERIVREVISGRHEDLAKGKTSLQ